MSTLVLPSDYAGGMVKYCSWDAFAPDGWPYVHHLQTDGIGARTKFAGWTKKFASKETGELVERFVKESQPKSGQQYFLSTALGSYEGWGANNNGDAFYEADLIKESDDVGYRSFVKHARCYEHHKNKDPKKAIGKIVLAAYNTKMRRVELVRELDNVKAASWIDAWHKTGSMPTSMGCKVAYDICSECQNRAKTPKEYCDHAKYAMKRLTKMGSRIHVRNPDPRFFDDSCVVVPAEKTAGAMEKLAHQYPGIEIVGDGHNLSAIEAEMVYELAVEKTAEDKTAVSQDVNTGRETALEQGMTPEQALSHETVIASTNDQVLSDENTRILKAAEDTDPELPLELLEKMATYPLEMAVASMHHLGIVPMPREFQFLALSSQGMKKVAAQLYEEDVTFIPQVAKLDEIDSYEKMAYVAEWNVSPTLVGDLTPFVPGRSYIPEFLEGRLASFKQLPSFFKQAADVVQAEAIRPNDPGVARIMVALGISYGIVRAIMGEDKQLASGLARVTKTHPAVAAALLTAGVAAGLKVVGSAMTPGSVAPRPGMQYEKVSSFIDDLEKTAADDGYLNWLRKTPKAVKHVVVPFSGGYLTSAYMRGKQMRGQQTSSVENVVADHPLATGVAATAGVALARKGLQKLVTAVKP